MLLASILPVLEIIITLSHILIHDYFLSTKLIIARALFDKFISQDCYRLALQLMINEAISARMPILAFNCWLMKCLITNSSGQVIVQWLKWNTQTILLTVLITALPGLPRQECIFIAFLDLVRKYPVAHGSCQTAQQVDGDTKDVGHRVWSLGVRLCIMVS